MRVCLISSCFLLHSNQNTYTECFKSETDHLQASFLVGRTALRGPQLLYGSDPEESRLKVLAKQRLHPPVCSKLNSLCWTHASVIYLNHTGHINPSRASR